MRSIGINGGSSLCEVGSPTDVKLFFYFVGVYGKQRDDKLNWSLLTDRLYRRYLRLEEVEEASVLMNKAKELFGEILSSSLNWDGMVVDKNNSQLNWNQPTLGDIFCKYFDFFFHCVESAKINYEGFKSYPGYEYQPVKIVIADQPWFMMENQRPLKEYDDLDGEPFWLR